jgi:hypothetical protein
MPRILVVRAMKRLNSKIRYIVSNTSGGAQIRISSDDADAVQAVQDFLKFQIQDHQTGDSLEVQK